MSHQAFLYHGYNNCALSASRPDQVLIVCLGGSLGWKTRGALVPEFAAVAFELGASTVGAPKYAEVKTEHGYHIIMVDARK